LREAAASQDEFFTTQIEALEADACRHRREAENYEQQARSSTEKEREAMAQIAAIRAGKAIDSGGGA
jgi:hypothetical protein